MGFPAGRNPVIAPWAGSILFPENPPGAAQEYNGTVSELQTTGRRVLGGMLLPD